MPGTTLMNAQTFATETFMTSQFVAMAKDGSGKVLRSKALRTASNIGEVAVKCTPIREIAEGMRRSGMTNLNGYFFQSSMSIEYNAQESVERLYADDIIIELHRPNKMGKYGVDYIAIGVPTAIYDVILAKACSSLGVTADDAAYPSTGEYTWINSVSCKSADYQVMDGRNKVMPVRFPELVGNFSHNVKCIAVLEPKLKATSNSADVSNAKANLRWKLAFSISQVFVHSTTTATAPPLSGSRDVGVNLPNHLADENVKAFISKKIPQAE